MNGDVQFVSLAAVADIHAAVDSAVFPATLPGENPSLAVFPRLRILRFSFSCGTLPADAPENGAGVIFHDVAGKNAEGRKRARKCGHDDVRNAESFGQSTGVQASSATKGDQREVAGIAAALNGDDADGLFHSGVHHANHSGGELVESEATSLPLQAIPQ